jgi:tetratricopeptide (TPR) repeat protein
VSASATPAAAFEARRLRGQARSELEKALAIDPTSTHPHYFLALAHETEGDLSGALEWLDRGLSISSADLRLSWSKAQILEKMGRCADAASRLSENVALVRRLALDDDPSGRTIDLEKRDWLVMNCARLANVLSSLGRDAEARHFLAEARRLSPDTLEVREN